MKKNETYHSMERTYVYTNYTEDLSYEKTMRKIYNNEVHLAYSIKCKESGRSI